MGKKDEQTPKNSPKPKGENDETEIEETDEVDETDETGETEETDETENEPPKAGKPRKKDIMDASNSAEPTKKKTAKFENKMDFSPVTDALARIEKSLQPKAPKKPKEEPKSESKGFLDCLGDW